MPSGESSTQGRIKAARGGKWARLQLQGCLQCSSQVEAIMICWVRPSKFLIIRATVT